MKHSNAEYKLNCAEQDAENTSFTTEVNRKYWRKAVKYGNIYKISPQSENFLLEINMLCSRTE